MERVWQNQLLKAQHGCYMKWKKGETLAVKAAPEHFWGCLSQGFSVGWLFSSQALSKPYFQAIAAPQMTDKAVASWAATYWAGGSESAAARHVCAGF